MAVLRPIVVGKVWGHMTMNAIARDRDREEKVKVRLINNMKESQAEKNSCSKVHNPNR